MKLTFLLAALTANTLAQGPYAVIPAEFAAQQAVGKSPLVFRDGSAVKTAADWQRRRAEILADWHGIMGAWPAIIEKPKIEDAPSDLIISGRYILQPEIFAKLAEQKPGAGGEIQLTDSMIELLADQAFIAYQFDGKTYDCGDKIGYLAANVAYALDRPDIGPKFRPVLDELMKR